MTEAQNTTVELALLKQKVETLTVDIEELSKKVEGLVEAWRAANSLISFIKGAAVLVGSIGVLIAAAKSYFWMSK